MAVIKIKEQGKELHERLGISEARTKELYKLMRAEVERNPSGEIGDTLRGLQGHCADVQEEALMLFFFVFEIGMEAGKMLMRDSIKSIKVVRIQRKTEAPVTKPRYEA